MDKFQITLVVSSWSLAIFQLIRMVQSRKRLKKSKLKLAESKKELFRQLVAMDFPEGNVYECMCVGEKCAKCRGYGITDGRLLYVLKKGKGPHEGWRTWQSDEEDFFAWADELWLKYVT